MSNVTFHPLISYVINNTTDGDVNASNVTDVYVTETEENADQFLLPWWQQTVFFLAFFAILLISAGGNLVVIWIVLAHKRMRTVTNYFLVNLAVADFLISILNLPFTFLFLLYQDWWFGMFFCKFSCFISPCTISVSVLTFMAIALDRYTAILYPLRPRMPKRHVISAICIIWVFSIGLSVPNLVYFNTVEYGVATTCRYTWPDETDLAYSYLLLVLNYIFPLLTLTVTYTRVGIELWGSRVIGEDTSMQHDRVKSKRKVVKMMMVVVVIFAICWLPMHLYFLLANHFPALPMFRYIQQIYIVVYLMAMSNSMYNPIIYCWMNSRFREGFVHVFCWCPCRQCKRTRTRLRFRRTLFPTSANAMSEKYTDRNGSMMHTMTEYVDNDSNATRRSHLSNMVNNRASPRKADDFV
ncbi:tachykinin-like peptides receptor 99D [Mya arenaria]|uniref:tachykinin-like peptides receptor 99D n=1 Tax=Mya arenaria TaxID=6604 RepID=UPI0022DFE07A|nr:tachykinin-like peptides receptor 99D [Mya arenaria]